MKGFPEFCYSDPFWYHTLASSSASLLLANTRATKPDLSNLSCNLGAPKSTNFGAAFKTKKDRSWCRYLTRQKANSLTVAQKHCSQYHCYKRHCLSEAPYPVVIDLLECFIADGPLKNHSLEGVAFVTGNQLHTDHFSFSYSHVTENLQSGRQNTSGKTAAGKNKKYTEIPVILLRPNVGFNVKWGKVIEM